jgi:tRNA(Arg) A34 adenosine deaminase TadA
MSENDPLSTPPAAVTISLPSWVPGIVDWTRRYTTVDDRMRLAITLARESAVRGGGPFGAAVFESESGTLVGVGVNDVVGARNSVLHAEVMAIIFAEARVGAYSLRAPGLPAHELVSSCEPCAMCLGATHWSGVRRLVFGARRDDAERIGFEEGPVFPESYRYLESRGIEVVGGVLRDEARAVLELYRHRGGLVYNA